ncbi:8795_t:CDS:1 [Funneliformis geosporum]|uniref:18675_t:CDS:1 n=1 Tax=Funneliformis geosporum TaxID=1117311 RepID=A0A9W4WMM6_9GLOM|nr:18675_t:CDS:1 [Funneliformis geosporum]CAI2178391.1 8795_t:CDS:1 [Funneliformis geosporum]
MSRMRDNIRIRDNVESEEDLLMLQEDFLANKPIVAATLIRQSKPPTVISSSSFNHLENNVDVGETQRDLVTLDDQLTKSSYEKTSSTSSRSVKIETKSKKKKSLFSTKRQKSNESGDIKSQRFNINLDQEMEGTSEQAEEHVPAIKKVLDMHSYQTGIVGAVTEKSVNEPVLPPSVPHNDSNLTNGGFPKPVHRSLFIRRKQVLSDVSRPNLDNIQHQQNNDNDNGTKDTCTSSNVSSSLLNTLNKDTKIFNSDYLEIDRENTQKISNMSEEEIIQTIEMLRQTLGPKLIEKLLKSKPLVDKISGESPEESKKKDMCVHIEETMENKETLPADFVDDENDDSFPRKMKEKYFPNVSIEPEKIEWMGIEFEKDKPLKNNGQILRDSVIPKSSDPPAAFYRFDFHGNILEKDADIPTYMGLHHHGDNPDQAGYTLSELFHLSRSRVPSQRIIPLNVIGRIMRKVRKGHYGIEKDKGIAEWMIKMKLPIYLRTALDDTSESVIVAAVDAISALIIGGSDGLDGEEENWDRFGGLYRGYEAVALREDTGIKVKRHFGIDIALQNENEEDMDTTDYHVELASRDLIAGLISMDILFRFRYILEKLRLPYNTNEQIILMLVRIARHSRKIAKSIFECPQLVDVIHKRFLCIAWPIVYNNQEVALSTQFPSLPAVKLFRLLCQSSENISQSVVQNYMETFLRYIVVNPSTISNEFEMNLGYKILQETLRIYQTLAAYGLYHGIHSQAYSVFCGYLSKEIIFSLPPSWQWKGDNIYQMRNKLDIAITFFRLLEIWIRVPKKDSDIDGESGAQPSEFVNDSVELLDKWVNSFPYERCDKVDYSEEFEKALLLISSIARYISSWYQYLSGYPLKVNNQIKSIWERFQLGSWQFSKICQYLSNRLPVCLNDYYLSKNDSWQLPNLPGAYYPGTFEQASKSVTISVLYDLYSSYISLIHRISNFFSNDKEFSANSLDVITAFVPIDLVQKHVIKVPPKGNWDDFFVRTRTYLLYEWWCAINTFIDNDEFRSKYSKKLLQAALIIMPNLLPGDEKISLDILNKIFDGIAVLSSDSKRAEQIKKSLRSFYKNHITSRNDKEEIYTFSGQQEEDLSLLWDLTKHDRHGGLPFSRAWLWIPIDILYSKRSDVVMDEEVRNEVVRDCLVFAWEIMQICQDITDPNTRYLMNPAIVVLSIMKIFLLEGELYRDSNIGRWIDEIFSQYTFGFRSKGEQALRDHETFNSSEVDYSLEVAAKDVLTKPFYTFFTDFSAAYAAESFGQKSFAQCVIVPLSNIYPLDFKLLVWSDLFETLSTINIEYEEVLCLNYSFNEGLKSYFWPLEDNKALLQTFVNSIIHNKLTRERTSFLYWVVIHHLNGFVFWTTNLEQVNRQIGNQEESKTIGKFQMRIDIAKAIVKGARSDAIKDWVKYTGKNFGEDVKELVRIPQCFEEIDSKLQDRLDWLKSVNIDIEKNLI